MIFLETSSLILDNIDEIRKSIDFAGFKYHDNFGNHDMTTNHMNYNLFSLLSLDLNFYNLYAELQHRIRGVLGYDKPLWMQAWLNVHAEGAVLDWHDHLWPWHGYICIDPQKTNTVFRDPKDGSEYKVENKRGQIYFGNGGIFHKVEVVESYPDFRTTIGFDVTDQVGGKLKNVSFIPF